MNDIYGRAGGFLSTSDVAADLDVTRATVLILINEGLLPATNVGDGNYRPRYGIRLEDLNIFKKMYHKYGVRNPNEDPNKRRGGKRRKPKKEEVKVEVKVDPRDEEEIRVLKKEMELMAEKLLEISVKLEELSKS